MTIDLNENYFLSYEVPTLGTYLQLRSTCGLSSKTRRAARQGLAGTLFSVQIRWKHRVVGMGRVVGDGGCFFQVVDIAVLPEHQHQGLGRAIMGAIMGYLEKAPPSAYVSLVADGSAGKLYAQFGFKEVAPSAVGMAFRVK